MTASDSPRPFANQHVLVVGGSSGIGFSTARCAGLAGADVTFVARNRPRLRETVESMCGAKVLSADLADMAQVPTLFRDMPEIDHLVIAAGTSHGCSLKEATSYDLQRTIKETLIGPLCMIKSAEPRLRKTGSVTLISGPAPCRLAGLEGVQAGAAAAIESMVRALAMELWPVRANGIAPGATDTSLVDTLLGADMPPMPGDPMATPPRRCVNNADDVAHAVLFLMSAGSVTGEVLHMEGSGRWTGAWSVQGER